MFKIKKILITLALLFLVFPIGVGAVDIKGGLCVGGGNFSFCAGTGGGGFGGGGFNLGDPMGLPSGSIYGIIGNIAYWLLGIFAFFGVIGFVVSGIMYLVSTGNDEMITKAKKYMTYSIVGVIVGLMGFVILQAAFSMLGGSGIF